MSNIRESVNEDRISAIAYGLKQSNISNKNKFLTMKTTSDNYPKQLELVNQSNRPLKSGISSDDDMALDHDEHDNHSIK